jgi:mono/diheme cytochrome c family protein
MKLLISRTTTLFLLLPAACGLAAQPRAVTSHSKTDTISRGAAKLDTGLVIVPFAIPVAVPVATVRQPSVLYSFRSYAAAYDYGSNQLRTEYSVPSTPVSARSGTSEAALILARRCAACHSGPSAHGGLRLFGDDGDLLARLPRRRVLEAVEVGRMPMPAEAARLTRDEIEVLRQWAQPPRELEY